MKPNPVLKPICFLLFFLILGAACAIPFYFESPSMFYKFGTARLLLRIGKISGILAGGLLLFQPVFVARFSFLDRIFAQDRLCRFHRANALCLTAAAAFHPVFVLWADGFAFFPLEMRYWPAFMGVGLLCLICLMTLISVFRTTVRMDRNQWFWLHRILAPLIMVLFFIHVLNVSKPFETGLPNRLLLLAAFFTICIFGRQWVLKTSLFKKKYRVLSVTPAAKDAWAVDVKSLSGKGFSYIPGQFAYITPIGKQIAREEHPFTIASSPLKTDPLQFVIRSCGDFTSRISYLEPGDILLIDGPYGQFSHVWLEEKTPVIMIAGGIGITPMLSMLRFMAGSRDTRKILLIWSNKTRDHIVFPDEFSDLARRLPNLILHHVITREVLNQENFQRINEDSLKVMLKGVDINTAVFLCGPPAMAASVKHQLNRLGFSCSRVYTESFVL